MKININCDKPYSVFINELDKIKLNTKVAVITNDTVKSLHVEEFLKRIEANELHVISIKDGEKYKNFETVNYILDECFKLKLDRKSVLIAFGGGVVGDMSGFVASIYQRGIDLSLIHI